VLNALAGSFSVGGKEVAILAERDEVLQRVVSEWPYEASPLLRLAAIANRLDERLDERLAGTPQQLSNCIGRAPWSVTPDESKTLLVATLLRLEQFDYESFAPDLSDTPMVLRDALTLAEDLSTIASMVRWESLARRQVSIPERLLESWSAAVAALERQTATGFDQGEGVGDAAEYSNDLAVRRHLQSFVAALSWTGQSQWREYIEPIDAAFREHTERRDVPLVLTLHAKPGAWWDYRLPAGVPDSPAWRIWPIDPTRYVAGGHSYGLRSVSYVWELAERPYGLRAMTEQELALWAQLCSHQAQAIARHRPNLSGWWPDQDQRAGEEQRRRAAED